MTGSSDGRRALDEETGHRVARLAVAGIACRRWESVAPLLMARVVPAGLARAAIRRPLGQDLTIEVVIDAGAATVIPSADLVRSWDRSPSVIWSTAADNVDRIRPTIRFRTLSPTGTTVAVCGGVRFTSAMVLDPRRPLRRALPRSVGAASLDHLVVLDDELVLVGSDPAVVDVANSWTRLKPTLYRPTLLVVPAGQTAAMMAER